jgi:glycosyltransferase involved in cell wall biosynthesis
VAVRTASDGGIVAALEHPVRPLVAGRPTAVFLYGHCFHPRIEIASLRILVDGTARSPAAQRMPRLDLPAYRSGFWAIVPIEPPPDAGGIDVDVEAELQGGGAVRARLCTIEVVAPTTRPAAGDLPLGEDTIAICMATFDPPRRLLQVQFDSIRAQTDPDWICLISDDCSSPERFAAIAETVGEDPRFVLSRSERRLGFYRNFERALEMVPDRVRLVALSDQDDRWLPDKLATLRAALGDAQLVHSDMRLVDAAGAVVRQSLSAGRRVNRANLASLLIANTLTGAAILFRREVLDFALPFAEGPGWDFHDHWLGLAALARGEVNYVDRPLYDYVQHPGAVLGQVVGGDDAGPRLSRPRLRRPRLRGRLAGWRGAYFHVYMHLQVEAQTLLLRGREVIAPRKRRTLERFVAAERRPFVLAWLAVRPLRGLVGRNETLGAELLVVRGILWRWLTGLRLAVPRQPRFDTSMPPFDPATFGQRRMRRWRAQRRDRGLTSLLRW